MNRCTCKLIAFAFFVLMLAPEVHANVNVLQNEIKDKSDYDKSRAYEAYIADKNTNPNSFPKILVKISRLDSRARFIVYAAMMRHEDITPKIISVLLQLAETLNVQQEALVYKEYLSRENIDLGIARHILYKTIDFNRNRGSSFLVEQATEYPFKAYLSRKSLNSDIVLEMFQMFHNIGGHSWYSIASIYGIYIKRNDADPKVLDWFLDADADFSKFEKSSIYQYYLARKGDVDSQIVSRIWQDVMTMPETMRLNIYSAFFNQTDADPESVSEIIKGVYSNDKAYRFSEKYKVNIYIAYMKRELVDADIIEGILKEASTFSKARKDALYAVYLRRDDSDPDKLARNFLGKRK